MTVYNLQFMLIIFSFSKILFAIREHCGTGSRFWHFIRLRQLVGCQAGRSYRHQSVTESSERVDTFLRWASFLNGLIEVGGIEGTKGYQMCIQLFFWVIYYFLSFSRQLVKRTSYESYENTWWRNKQSVSDRSVASCRMLACAATEKHGSPCRISD